VRPPVVVVVVVHHRASTSGVVLKISNACARPMVCFHSYIHKKGTRMRSERWNFLLLFTLFCRCILLKPPPITHALPSIKTKKTSSNKDVFARVRDDG
jgi:hypothetical protein